MPRKSYTVLILPHARARFRKLHLTRGHLLSVGAVLGALLLAGLLLPHLMFRVQAQAGALAELERHNDQLRQQKLRFESSVDELSRKLNVFEEQAGRLASALGVEQLPSSQPAAGGSAADGVRPQSTGSPYAEELNAIGERARRLDRSLEQLDDTWREREGMLASTPSLLPVRGWFSHGFGWRKDPFTGKRAFHRGLDIVAPERTPVRAPADGVVTTAGRLGPYGKRIDISHGYGYVTRYGHLSEVTVKPGTRVRRGDVIGRVGSTGRSTGPHLHYEVFRDGRRVNPWRYLGEKGF